MCSQPYPLRLQSAGLSQSRRDALSGASDLGKPISTAVELQVWVSTSVYNSEGEGLFCSAVAQAGQEHYAILLFQPPKC